MKRGVVMILNHRDINCSSPEVQLIEVLELALGEKLAMEMYHVHLHVFSNRVCAPHATIFNVNSYFFSVYFPASWECDEAVEQVYDFFNCTHVRHLQLAISTLP